MNKQKLALVLLLVLTASCGNDTPQTKAPIVLGDSSSIVTEKDPKYLTDFVADIHLRALEEAAPPDTTAAPENAPADTGNASTNAPAPAPQDEGDGLHVNFKEVQLFIPGIETKSFQKQDLQKASGASYQLTDGNIRTNKLVASGATINKVSQRYQTTVFVKTDDGRLELDNLGTLTDWQELRGNEGSFTIANLEPSKLETKAASAATIKNAVTRAARNKRLSRQSTRNWEQAVRNVRSVRQKPLQVVLESIMWKIEGKDSNGRPFVKQLRLDMPV